MTKEIPVLDHHLPPKHDIDALLYACREANDKALISASGGNVSVRTPAGDTCLVSGTGIWLGRMELSDLVVAGIPGGEVEGHVHPSSEYKIHTFTYDRRPDVQAIVHFHPQWTVLATASGIPIRPLSLDHVSYLTNVVTVPFSPNGSDSLGNDVADAAASGSNVIVMEYHGCVCLGENAYDALRLALNLEEAARASVFAALLKRTDVRFPDLSATHA